MARQLAKDCLDDVTEAANALLLKGNIDIYQSRQSDVQEALRKLQEQQHQKAFQVEDAVGTVAAIPKVLWEYRGSQDHHIHGPYSSQEMLNWIQAGYFVGPSAVQVRSVQQPLLQLKSTQDDLLSDLLDDDVDENDGAGEKQKEEDALIVRGEWQMSDKVDFARHVAT